MTSLISPRFIADKSRICSLQIKDLLATILQYVHFAMRESMCYYQRNNVLPWENQCIAHTSCNFVSSVGP